METNGRSSASYLTLTPCVPLFCSTTLFTRGGNRRAFRFPGEGGDHFHCTVEPSPGHVRCRSEVCAIQILGSVSGRADFSRIFVFGPPDFFADFVAGFLLLIFVGKSILQENPRQNPPKFTQQKSPTHFCRGAGSTNSLLWKTLPARTD